MKSAIEQEIKQELEAIHRELKYIREHMVDVDMFLTPDEEKILNECIDEYEKGKSIPLSKLKSERK